MSKRISVVLFAFLFFGTLFFVVNRNTEMQKSKQQIQEKLNLLERPTPFTEFSEEKKTLKGKVKTDEPNKYAEYFRRIKTREGQSKPEYPDGYRIKELKKAKQQLQKLAKTNNKITEALPWIERGPGNVGGRTRGLVVDPDDPSHQTWFVGSVGGGIWKTTDGGATWVNKTPDLPNLATTVIVMAESNHDVMYAGTGEGFFNLDAVEGDGIFKSTDRGETWTQLSSTIANSDFNIINRIVVDPNNEDIVVAATNNGIYKSTDGGATWTKTYSAGRVQDLVANPLNFNFLYATRNSVGVLKSLDAGDTWFESSNGISGVNRLEIDIAPSDTSRLYVSAEGSSSKLYMSLDSGENWVEVTDASTNNYDWLGGQGWYDNTIAVHPYNENIVFYGGIDLWRAEIIFDSVQGITSVEENGTEAFMSYKPSGLSFLNGGVGTGEEYWDETVASQSDYVSVEIRYGPGKSQKAHRFINNTFVYKDYVDVPFEVWDVTNNIQLMVSFLDLQKNTDYNLIASRGDEIFVHAVAYDSTAPHSSIAQDMGAKYKNIYVVTPKNAIGVTWDPANLPESNLRINSGYVPVYKRNSVAITDGYNQYGESDRIHVDHHNILVIPINEATNEFALLNANDGGVAYSSDGGETWVETDQNGYNTTQFYGVDKKPGADEYWGGTQDNGTWQSPTGTSANASSAYTHQIGGDGFEVAWHYGNGNKLIGGSQYNRFWRTTDNWNTYEAANNGFNGWGNSSISPFISKIASSKSDPDLLFTITREGVYRSDNFAASWKLIPITQFWDNGNYFSQAQVAISIADPQVVWAGVAMTSTRKLHVSKDGGLSFTPVNNFDNVGGISGLDTHPTDPATAFALFSYAGYAKIIRTTDYGNTWTDITGFGSGSSSSNGFPDVAVYCVLVMPYNTDIIWAGTDIGIVESIDNGASWHLAANGLPNVAVWEMKIVDDQVVVATHGRGIWSVTLPELSGYTPPVVTLSPRINGEVGQSVGGITINASLRSVYDSTLVMVDNAPVKTVLANAVKDTTLQVPLNTNGEITVYLASYKDGRIYKSSSSTITVASLLQTRHGYVTDFSSNTDDFLADGFTFGTVSGFDSEAAHSPHPYENSSEYLLFLRVPIIVATTDATFQYDDVAIIEPGEAGTRYGDTEFWDYVVVEGSNGGDWIPLGDGYDARLDNRWLNAYNSDADGNSSMFRTHTINLLDYFNPGETIIIRFRMFADQFVTGWGWAIDNIKIQDQFVGIDDPEVIPTKFALEQNYPNPFNPSTTIKFSIPQKTNVKLNIYNSIGELVTTLVNEEKPAGNYSVKWDSHNLASGIYYYRISAGDFNEVKKMILMK